MPDDLSPARGGAVLDALLSRSSVKAADLVAPGPTDSQLERAFAAACCAPDHGGLRPWRFIVFRGAQREALGRLREAALAARDPATPPAVLETERMKADRAPVAIVVGAKLRHGHRIPVSEQMASVVAATMNMLNAFHAMGLGAILVSGFLTEDEGLRTALGFAKTDALLGYVHVGTLPAGHTPHQRPDPARFWRDWTGAPPHWEQDEAPHRAPR